MTLDDFKDWLFDVLNDTESDALADIETNERTNTFCLSMVDDSTFEIECRVTET